MHVTMCVCTRRASVDTSTMIACSISFWKRSTKIPKIDKIGIEFRTFICIHFSHFIVAIIYCLYSLCHFTLFVCVAFQSFVVSHACVVVHTKNKKYIRNERLIDIVLGIDWHFGASANNTQQVPLHI